jgi:hypothetical protein
LVAVDHVEKPLLLFAEMCFVPRLLLLLLKLDDLMREDSSWRRTLLAIPKGCIVLGDRRLLLSRSLALRMPIQMRKGNERRRIIIAVRLFSKIKKLFIH